MKKHVLLISLSFLVFIFSCIFFLPKNTFAVNSTAECYICIVNNYSSSPPCYDQCNANGTGTKQIQDMLESISAMNQAGPAQPDATSCNQFLNKLLNDPGALQSVRKRPGYDGVTTKQFYDDFKRIGILQGNFCTEDWLNKGQADINTDDQIHGDCGKCNAYCDSQPNPYQCFQSECSGIVDCTHNWGKDALALNPFSAFLPISGGFGENINNLDVNAFLQDVLTYGSAVLGGLAVLKIIFGGVMYATAAGNAQRISDAKSHILYALIGVALIAGANIILWLFGATNNIPSP